MFNVDFLYGISKEEQRDKWKKSIRQVGEEVYSFFQDVAPDKGYAIREGQWDMACEITDAMRDKKHILVEAGVGTGKTFGYIVPLLYYHKRYKRPIVIATSTIALQEQLASDIEQIQKMIGYSIPVSIIKGQNHFVCMKRCDQYFIVNNNEKNDYMYEKIKQSGYERNSWDFIIPDNIWKEINIKDFNPNFCRQKCIHQYFCYYYNLRKKLLCTNGIVICNQDWLTANLRKRKNEGKQMLTDRFEFVVIDEAHNLENKVRNAFTTDFNYSSLIKAVEQAKRINKNLGETLDAKIAEYHRYLDELFLNLEKQILEQDKIAKQEEREIERYYVERDIPVLKELTFCIKDILLTVSMQFGVDDSYKNKDFDMELEALEKQVAFFESMLEKNSKDIFWMSSKGKGKKSVTISNCPKNVNEITEDLFFSEPKFSTILTSATITSGKGEDYTDNYKYFVSNTNFPIDTGHISEPKESPFEYNKHAMIYYTENMPHPSKKRKEFIEKGVTEIIKLLEISNGKALILFTAKSDMLEVYEKLKNKVPYKILMQNDSMSQSEIITEFKNDVNSVLLGTGTYWEGISVEGLALSNLIIFKLPFPVPEPIIDYKRENAKDPLMEVSVPEMVIKLKQGIGRLIRSENDFGIVSIIDSRVGENSKVPYKKIIWDALPIKSKTSDITRIKKFYDSLTIQDNKVAS